jgi:hypothetical protein
MWNRILPLVVLLAMSSCTRDQQSNDDPKRRLNEYISLSFSAKGPGDREKLVSYLTGQAKTRLTAWSDDQFKQAFVDSKRQFLRLVFTEEKKVSPTEVNLTYELTYVDQGRGHDAKVTNKKLCQMVLDRGIWFIKDVSNIKELVEYRNEMTFPY